MYEVFIWREGGTLCHTQPALMDETHPGVWRESRFGDTFTADGWKKWGKKGDDGRPAVLRDGEVLCFAFASLYSAAAFAAGLAIGSHSQERACADSRRLALLN